MADAVDISGHCLCGGVTYKAKAMTPSRGAGVPLRMCRRWTGGPLMFIEVDGVPSFEGRELVGVYQSSETSERGFCTRCGLGVVLESGGRGALYIHGGLAERRFQARFHEGDLSNT